MPLLNDTLILIAESDMSLAAIARLNGVSVRWLDKVQLGQIPEPSVVKIQRLNDFLLSRKKQKRRTA